MPIDNPFAKFRGKDDNPFARFRGVIGEAEKKTGRALELLERPREAVQAAIAGKNGADVFVHGESGGESDVNRAALRHRIGLDNPNSVLGKGGTYQQAPHWQQGLVDTFLDAITDPASLLGAAGAGRKAVGAALEKGAPTAIKAFEGARAGASGETKKVLDFVGKKAEQLSDFTTPGGKDSARLARDLALKTGSNETYQRLYALRNIYQARRAELIEKFGQDRGEKAAKVLLGQYLQKNGFMHLGAGPNGAMLIKNGIPGGKAIEKFMEGSHLPNDPFIKASNLGKATLFWNPLPHMRNIASLVAAHDPAALAGTLKNFIRLKGGFAGDATRANVLGEAEKGGLLGRNAEQSQLEEVLKKIPGAGKALAGVYHGSGKILWGFDDAAKAAVYQTNLRRFKDPLVAGYHTLQQLVDYNTPAALTQRARYLAPFATWRTRMPVSVLRAVLESPQNVLALKRLSGGALTGDTGDLTGRGKKETVHTPISETLGMADTEGLLKYLRGSLGPTARLAGDVLQTQHLAPAPDRYSDFYTWGVKPGDYLLHQGPVGDLLTALGHPMFKGTTPQDELLYDLLGVQTYE